MTYALVQLVVLMQLVKEEFILSLFSLVMDPYQVLDHMRNTKYYLAFGLCKII